MSFKLHGSPFSTCTRTVAFIPAKERNIPYEFIHVDLKKGDHKQPAYLEYHPFGQVPYISMRCLSSSPYPCSISYTFSYSLAEYESCAIGRYLATFGSGPDVIPMARAKCEQAASIEYHQFQMERADRIRPSFGKDDQAVLREDDKCGARQGAASDTSVGN